MKKYFIIVILILSTINAKSNICSEILGAPFSLINYLNYLHQESISRKTEKLIQALDQSNASQEHKQQIWDKHIELVNQVNPRFVSIHYSLNTNKGRFVVYFGNFLIKGVRNFLIILPDGSLMNTELNNRLQSTVRRVLVDQYGRVPLGQNINLKFTTSAKEKQVIDNAIKQVHPNLF